MSLKNTNRDYGTIAKTIHWVTALLFLGSYSTYYYRAWFTEPRTPENWNAVQLHFSIGVTVFVLVLLRILSRKMQVTPDPEPGTALQHKAAKAGHLALYGIMILTPLTGYLGTGAATEWFFLFDIPAFKDTGIFTNLIAPMVSYETFEKAMDFLHKAVLGEWVVWMLIVGHAGAALYHHFVKGDRTLRRMTRG